MWLGLLLFAILSGFGVTAYALHRTQRLAQVDYELGRRVVAVDGALAAWRGRGPRNRLPGRDETTGGAANAPPIRLGQHEARLPAAVLDLFDEATPDGAYFVVWSRSGDRSSYPTDRAASSAKPELAGGDTAPHTRMRDGRREVFRFNELGECILAGCSLRSEVQALRRFGGWLVGAGLAVLAVGLGGAWWLTGRALRLVDEISTAAKRIAEGDLAERIPVAPADRDNELGRMAGVLNTTFARLDAAFARQRRFTADAAHELRTPIAVLVLETQSALARERDAAEYRATVEACLATSQQMRRFADSLLELARLDAGQEPLQRRQFDLTETTRACTGLVQPLADARSIRIFGKFDPAITTGDAGHLGQVVTNLLTNAIHHNRDGGEVHIATSAENGFVQVTVMDNGHGIDPADLPHIFDRFYRADQARTGNQGRCGLGLAISRAIVDAHQGSLSVTSRPGEGSTFTLRLPVA